MIGKLPSRAPTRPFVAEIIDAACLAFDVNLNDVMSHRRHRPAARARQAAMFLAKEMTPLSLSQIGRRLNRDHTTVLHATREVPRLMAADAGLARRIRRTRRLASLRAALRAVPAL